MSITGSRGVVDQRDLSGVIGRHVLALLTLANGPIGRYEVIDAVWGGRSTKAVDSTLNATLSRLRSALVRAGGDADAIIGEQGQIEFRGHLFTSDYHDAVRAGDRCVPMLHRQEFAEAWVQATIAFSISNRRLLAGIESEWLDHRRDHLHHLVCRSLAVVVIAAMARDRAQDAIFAARELVRREPHSDRGVQLLVATLLNVGDRGASRLAVHEWAARLQSELGVLPDDHTLQALDRSINRRSDLAESLAELVPLIT